MRVGAIKLNQRIATSMEKFAQKGGEKVSNYVNATGKAVIAPLIIMHNPFTHESEENKKWAAIKQPVEAVITLGMQLATLGILYKGINALIKRGNINFKFVKEATEDINKIPKKILEACNNDKEKAIKAYEEQFNEIFKDRIGAIVSAITYIPVLAVSNKIYPKIAHKLVDKDENKPNK